MNTKAPSEKTENTDEISDLVETDTLPNLSTEEITKLRRHALMRRFWRSASHYWKDYDRRRARVLTAALVIIILLGLATSYAMNLWNRAIFDALQNHDGAAVLRLALLYLLLLAASVVVAIALVFARMTMQRRWRAWLTTHLFDLWLQHGRYYQLNLISGDHQNPEYRIADDVRVATEAPVDFATGVLTATLSAITFIVVLWTIGGALTVQIGTHTVTIPGFLVIAAVLYAALASVSMVVIGRRFVTVSENKNQSEAEFRYVLTRLRENGESIAVLGGEEEERNGLNKALSRVLRNWRDICVQTMRTTTVSQTSNYVSGVLPILLCAPKFLDGSMTLGEVMQAASAFTIVQTAFSWLVDNYPRLSDWTASASRVATLMVSLDGLERAEGGKGFAHIERGKVKGVALRLRDLSVTLDDGTAVVKDAEVAIEPGERVLVAGESGTGKSTLVRAISGLWPWGEGTVEVQKEAKMFLMPQKAYVPTGTLHRAATYPASPEQKSEKDVAEALKKVGLKHLIDRIEEEGPWDQILSGGEKQRLAFARIMLHEPDIIVLDEATSALDPASQDELMKLLTDELEATTIVSVGHRPELEQFHDRKITLERRRGGAKLVTDVELVPRPSRRKLLRRLLERRRSRRQVTSTRTAAK
jgi:putative ATP-binding cassette transporter